VLHSKFEASPGYIARPCLKGKEKEKEGKDIIEKGKISV
jgi:hypothetical protein